MPQVLVAGGGLAGLAAAAALGSAGYEVEVLESRDFLGGRATSYAIPQAEGPSEVIDNCQHILLRCCVNLLDFYRRLGVLDRIRFHREFTFIEPGGRTSVLKAGALPAPAHFTGSFLGLRFLGLSDKIAVARGLLAIRREAGRGDLDSLTMTDWLREKSQTPAAIERFWRPVLVSAINEDLERMAASHGFQVFRLGFLDSANGYEMGVPAVPLGQLYGADCWRAIPGVRFSMRTRVERIGPDELIANGERRAADHIVSALPCDRIATAGAALGLDLSGFEHSPITGIHLWFDRPVTERPHGALLDRTIQWFFNKADGRYLQLVVSASRKLIEMPRDEIIRLATAELGEFLPAVRGAVLTKAHVVKEVRATFSARPGLEKQRPPSGTQIGKVFLAGDWTRSGWPSTMEGAVRSGYLAAEAITRADGRPVSFVLPDLARE